MLNEYLEYGEFRQKSESFWDDSSRYIMKIIYKKIKWVI